MLVVQPVYANGGSYGWSLQLGELARPKCWTNLRARERYPPDSLRDGVLNSFNNRINQAIATWNAALNNAGYVVPTDVLRMTDPCGAPQIEVTQYQFGSGSSLWGDATSYSQSGVNSCVMHSTSNDWLGFAHIRTDVHDDWWTQEDSRRAYWEDCPARNYLPAYTCSKDRDFESLLAHELGHALGRSRLTSISHR